MDLKVNRAEWNGLSGEDRAKVESIVGNFFKEAKIVPDDATPLSATAKAIGFGSPFCKIACDVAQTAATTACNGLGNPIAIAVCVAAAQAAGDACRNAC